MIATPFKLTESELVCSAAATVLLNSLSCSGTPDRELTCVCEHPQYGFTASASLAPCGPKFVRITDIKAGNILWQEVPYCECPEPAPYSLARGDLLIARSGSVGKSFIVSEVPEQAVFASYMIRLRSKDDAIGDYIYWCMQSQQFWNQVMGARRGSAMKNINGKMLASLRFPFPNAQIQQAVCAFLSSVRARQHGSVEPLPNLPIPLGKERRIVARIEALAAKIVNARKLRDESRDGIAALTHSKLAGIFHELEHRHGRTAMDTIIRDAGYGTSVKCDYERGPNSIPVLRIPNVASETTNLDDLKFGSIPNGERVRVLLEEDDLLIVRTNGSSDLVGRCAVVRDLREPTAFASYLIRIQFHRIVVDADFAQLMLRHLRDDGQLIDFARTTAGQYNVSLGRLRSAEIPLPPLAEQRRIVAYLDSLSAKAESLKSLQHQSAAELDALLPSILDRAFKGEL